MAFPVSLDSWARVGAFAITQQDPCRYTPGPGDQPLTNLLLVRVTLQCKDHRHRTDLPWRVLARRAACRCFPVCGSRRPVLVAAKRLAHWKPVLLQPSNKSHDCDGCQQHGSRGAIYWCPSRIACASIGDNRAASTGAVRASAVISMAAYGVRSGPVSGHAGFARHVDAATDCGARWRSDDVSNGVRRHLAHLVCAPPLPVPAHSSCKCG